MRLSEHEIDRRVRQTAAAVGISEELLGKSPFELSGGEKRRVAIAGVSGYGAGGTYTGRAYRRSGS